MRQRRGLQRSRNFYGWLIRSLITAGAITWRRGFDRITIAAFVLAAGAMAIGIWDEQRPKPQEDLTKQIFGEHE